MLICQPIHRWQINICLIWFTDLLMWPLVKMWPRGSGPIAWAADGAACCNGQWWLLEVGSKALYSIRQAIFDYLNYEWGPKNVRPLGKVAMFPISVLQIAISDDHCWCSCNSPSPELHPPPHWWNPWPISITTELWGSCCPITSR